MFFVDTSREVYVPMMINQGASLYKDIFNVYAPLGYQLNAFFISLFGEKLETFYYLGFFNSTFIMFGLFLLARLFFKKNFIDYIIVRTDNTVEKKIIPLKILIPFLFLLFVTVCCFYSISLTNYIFPYSYSMVYALNTFIWSLLALLYFYKKNKTFYLYFSCLLYGASCSFKYEFMLFGLVIFLVIILKRINLKSIIISLFYLFCIPLISFLLLVFQNVTINDLKDAFNYIILLSKSTKTHKLYTFLGFMPSVEKGKELVFSFFKTITVILYFSIVTNFLVKRKKENIISKLKLIKNFSIFLLLLIVPSYFLYKTFCMTNAYYFNWIGIFSLVLYIYSVIKIIQKHNNLLVEYKLFFLMFTAVITASVKCILNISFNSYGTYYFPLLLLCILVFFEYNITDESLKKTYNRSCIMILVLLTCFYYLSNLTRVNITNNHFLVFERGTIAVSKEISTPIAQTIKYITDNTNKNDTILVLPEGSMINFLTNRKSNNKYYYLIPPNIEIFGEENIIVNLEKNLPDYIIIQPMSYINFGETYFCESFGQKICTIIPKYYEKPIVFGNDFWLAIYKKKNI